MCPPGSYAYDLGKHILEQGKAQHCYFEYIIASSFVGGCCDLRSAFCPHCELLKDACKLFLFQPINSGETSKSCITEQISE